MLDASCWLIHNCLNALWCICYPHNNMIFVLRHWRPLRRAASIAVLSCNHGRVITVLRHRSLQVIGCVIQWCICWLPSFRLLESLLLPRQTLSKSMQVKWQSKFATLMPHCLRFKSATWETFFSLNYAVLSTKHFCNESDTWHWLNIWLQSSGW